MAKEKLPEGTSDCETDPFLYEREPRPFAWCIKLGDNITVFWGDEATQKYIEHLKQMSPCRLYVHNGGKFDFFFLLGAMRHGKLKLVNGRIMQIRIGQVILVDSYPLIPFALERYKKDEIDYKKFEREVREDNKREIIDYLVNDCVYLDELVQGFKAIVGNHMTIGGAAMNALKKFGYEVWSGNKTHDARFRPFYFGGRVEAFETGVFKGEFEYMDINSAYPFAMTHAHGHGPSYAVSDSFDERPESFVRMIAVSRGALPVRTEDGLFFPVDNTPREYFATGHEVLAGLETDTLRIIKVIECFQPKNKIEFCGFVNKYFALRQEAKRNKNIIEELAYKTLSNSGYGKFAQNPENFKDWCIEPRGEPLPGWNHETDFLDLTLWSRPSSNIEKSYFDVATAASITGFVRAHLWKALCLDAVKPLYCDTDSIICSKFRAKNKDAKTLGKWKTEMLPKKVAIAGKKLYAVTDGKEVKIASKGVRLTFGEIERIIKNDVVQWKKDAPSFSLRFGARWVKRDIELRG